MKTRVTIEIESEDAALAGVGPKIQALLDAIDAEGGVVPLVEKVVTQLHGRFAGGGAGEADLPRALAAIRTACPHCKATPHESCTLTDGDQVFAVGGVAFHRVRAEAADVYPA